VDQSKTLVERMNEALARVREFCLADGGNVQVVKFEDRIAHIEFKGACRGCPMKETTLAGVAADLRRHFKQVAHVKEVQ
jgi:Fe-S cluster biogenesis protein NfuA